MSRARQQLALGFVMVLAVNSAHASSSRQNWDFNVSLDGKVIGTHRFASYRSGEKRYVDINASFDVKILFINAYRYRHDNREVWNGECLQSIHSTTDDNGKQEFVKGTMQQGQLQIKTTGGEETLSGCIKTFAYWDPAFLRSQKLLNAQTGELLDVTVQSLGDDAIQVRGKTVKARHYRLVTRKFDIDLWYSPQRKWLALKSTTESGAVLQYTLQ